MDHKDLEAWKQTMQLAEEVYKLTSSFPKDELYGLTSQMRRAAVSIPSNLSEGAGRPSKKEFAQFLGFCMGSLAELETQLILARRLGYADPERLLDSLARSRALVSGLRKSVNK